MSVSNFLSSGYAIPTSWHTFPASSGQICFCPRASAASTLPPLQKKKVGAVGEECVFSLRVALHERFQTGNNHPRHKERALLSLLGGVARGELKDWNLVIGTNRQRKRTRCLRERSIFFFPPHELYRNAFSVGPSIRPESITTFRRVHHTFALRESQLAWVQDREGSYRQLANMERQTI